MQAYNLMRLKLLSRLLNFPIVVVMFVLFVVFIVQIYSKFDKCIIDEQIKTIILVATWIEVFVTL